MTNAEIKKLRKQAAQQRRRIILNTDAGIVHAGDPDHPETFLDHRLRGLHETHVDTVCFCTDYGFSHYTHNSKVSQVVTYQDSSDDPAPAIIQALIDKGTDTIEVAGNYCHENGMEIFWSMRMNDAHDGWIPEAISQWKKNHPECLFGTTEKRPWHAQWTGVDYAQPAVRDQVFAILEDVCSRYDIDGVELDFFKDPVFFKSMAWGWPVMDAERDMMTDLLGRVRQMADEIGRQRGRPLLIAARLPDSIGYSRAIGLDLKRWLDEDLIDIYIPSGYWRLQPWERSVELGHRYQVPVYPCIEPSRVKELFHPETHRQGPKARRLDEAYYGDALTMCGAGA